MIISINNQHEKSTDKTNGKQKCYKSVEFDRRASVKIIGTLREAKNESTWELKIHWEYDIIRNRLIIHLSWNFMIIILREKPFTTFKNHVYLRLTTYTIIRYHG